MAIRTIFSNGCRLANRFTVIRGPAVTSPIAFRAVDRSIRPYSTEKDYVSQPTPEEETPSSPSIVQLVKQEEHQFLSEDEQVTEAAVPEEHNDAPEAPTAEVSSIPWYLQVEAPKLAVRPLSERQKIPEVPESSPDILEPLLQQISVELGIDDLTLLDLRDLDPPPALGANLMMIIGTARSEKHLHVSADRLCRWLRSNYKLRPDADGLLGRNEIKLKLKRKARRAKLVGNKAGEEMDDGVRTGWVCVNVGTVEAANPEAEVEPRAFVGFGRRSDGIKIVVQMLVEEKRIEVDLEKLWTGISKRQALERQGNEEIESAVDDNPPRLDLSTSDIGHLHAVPAAQ